MRFSKDKKKYYGFGTVGSEAYFASPVWKLGFHNFENDGWKVLRLCFLRTQRRTYYCQYEWQIGEDNNGEIF